MKHRKIQISESEILSRTEMLAEELDLTGDSGASSGSDSGTDSGTKLTKREQACVGKKYGDSCNWTADNGSPQSGYCIYDKWSLTKKPLFCAQKDYRGTDELTTDEEV